MQRGQAIGCEVQDIALVIEEFQQIRGQACMILDYQHAYGGLYVHFGVFQ
jgi:hypothetical protein